MQAEKLLNLIEEEKAIPLHVMSRESFLKEHIPGSVWIPLNRVEEHFFEGLDIKKIIVPYCKNSSCMSSVIAMRVLKEHGFQAERYPGGIEEWKELGLKIESGD